jgi:hypothetical protein
MPHLERRLLVASRMKDARVNSGLSQRDVAEALCIGASTYCRIGTRQNGAICCAAFNSQWPLWIISIVVARHSYFHCSLRSVIVVIVVILALNVLHLAFN